MYWYPDKTINALNEINAMFTLLKESTHTYIRYKNEKLTIILLFFPTCLFTPVIQTVESSKGTFIREFKII